MKRWALLAFLLLIPKIVLAQAVSGLTLTPPTSDISVIYLADIFGVVDGVLFGTGSQLLGTLFGIYNGAILILAGIIFMYTFFTSTINTAHEGQLMGKDFSSVWVPLRSVGGIALLIPKASGYSFIQIFMVWVAVQGVGAADSVWDAALNYLYTGGVVIVQNNPNASGAAAAPLIRGAGTLLQSLTCTAMLQQEFTNYSATLVKNGASPLQAAPNFQQDILTAINSTGPAGNIPFPDSNYYGTNGACGSVAWDSVQFGSIPNMPPALLAQVQNDRSRSTAVYQMVTYLYPVAQSIVSNYFSPQRQALGELDSTSGIWGGPNNGPFLIQGPVLSNAAATYSGSMTTVLNFINQAFQNPAFISAWESTAQQEGWALAATYYYDIVNLNSIAHNVTDSDLPRFTGPANDLTQVSSITNYLGGASSPNVLAIQTLVNTSTDPNNYFVGPQGPFASGAITFATTASTAGIASGANGNLSISTGNSNADSIMSSLGSSVGSLNDLFSSQATNENPIIALAQMGSGFINQVFSGFITMAIVSAAITAGLAAIPFVAIGTSIITLMIGITSLMFPIMIALFSVGLIMAFYLPMIPFIIFTFGVIGWFIAVIEAVISAPLVAIGIGNPEGHAIMGKASPAVAQLANIFLRPSLMIFGLLVGMSISYVGVWLVNIGFAHAFAGATGNSTGIFKPIALSVIYTLIVMQIMHKSFSMIYLLPDEWAKWVGANVKGFGKEEEAEKAIAGGAQASASEGGKMAGTLHDKGAAMGKDMKNTKDVTKQSFQGSGDSASGSGGGGGSGAGGGGA